MLRQNVLEYRLGHISNGQNNKSKLRPKRGISKRKLVGQYFNYDNQGHKSADNQLPRKENPSENVINDVTHDVSDINLFVEDWKVSLVGLNSRECWINTEASQHVCSNRDLFTTLESVNGDKIIMRNFPSSIVDGQGKVFLKMSSKMLLTLKNVL